MKKVFSKQTGVGFVWCSSPVTIDKRADWGDAGDNLQVAPNGAFLKMKTPTEISHLVQPNADKTAPVGWIKGESDGLYDKQPIYIGDTVEVGQTIKVNTLDGEITYTATEPSVLCANEKDGQPDLNDMWVQKWSDLEKNYIMD